MPQYRRVAVIATALALTAPILPIVSSAPAHADDYCDYEDSTFPTLTGFGPSTVVVGQTSTLVKFHVNASDECGIDGWTISGQKALISAYTANPSETIYALGNSYAGTSSVDVSAEDPAGNTTTKRFNIKLLRRANWKSGSGNATPEPVSRGKSIKITGTLTRADWDLNTYTRYGSGFAKAQVQFKRKGTTSWKTVKTVTVGKRGVVSTTVKVKGTTAHDGSYRLSYAGNPITSSAATGGDFVDVRGVN